MIVVKEVSQGEQEEEEAGKGGEKRR